MKMCLDLRLRYMIPFYQHIFEWLLQNKPFTKWFLQHAYINENSTRSDCIRLLRHFCLFVYIFFRIQNVVIIQTSSTR